MDKDQVRHYLSRLDVHKKVRNKNPGQSATLQSLEGYGAAKLGNCFQTHEGSGVRSSQHGFTSTKMCLTNLINSYGEKTGFVDEKRTVTAVDEKRTVTAVYPHFRKDFGTDSSKIVKVNMKYGLDEKRAGLNSG